jgi:hypothetical protein
MPLIESSHVFLVHELAALGSCISLLNGRPLIVREPQWHRPLCLDEQQDLGSECLPFLRPTTDPIEYSIEAIFPN